MHSISPHMVKKKFDLAEILQERAYGKSTRTVKTWFGLGDFSSSYLSKITHKSIP